jgi:hypothetical protein
MTSRAVIAGATGLIGSNLAEHLVSKGWEVYGVARKPQTGIPGVRPVAADLLEPEALRASLAGIDPTHVFLTTWVRRASEEENIAGNGALVRNVLAALERSKNLKHVAPVTGLKHYLGPFEIYAEGFDMTNMYGRAMAQMASVFAELERAMIRERTRSAMNVKRLRGERISGHAPFGSDFGAGGKLVENAREQKIIVRMRRLRAEGLSYRGIAVRLDDEGILPKRGKRWIHTTVKSILARNAA